MAAERAPVRTDASSEALRVAVIDDLRASAVRRRALPCERIVDDPSLLAYSTDVASADVNHVVRADLGSPGGPIADAAIAARIDDAITLFGGRPFLWWVSAEDRPADLSDRLVGRGIEFLDEVPGMAMDLDDLADQDAAAAPPGFSVAPVLDAAALTEFHDVLTQGFPEDWTDERSAATIMASTHAIALETGFLEPHGVPSRWIGRVAGRPVTTTRLHTSAGVAGIYAVVTKADARRQGYGQAITRAVLVAARDAGLRIATLQASDAGRRIYERIGFREVCRFRLHEWSPRRVDGTPDPAAAGDRAGTRAVDGDVLAEDDA